MASIVKYVIVISLLEHNLHNKMLTLLKGEMETLFKVLRDTQGILSLSEARIRDAFLKELGALIETYSADRLAIFTKIGDKNEDGTTKTEPKEDGTATYFFSTPEQKAEFSKELTTLNQEEVTLKASTQLKEIAEKTSYKPQYGEAEIIDAILAKI